MPITVVVATSAFLFFSQERLLFAGANGAAKMPSHDTLPGALPGKSGQPRAWVAEPPAKKSARATVVFFHGNFALAQHMFDARWPFVEAGLRVVFVEYPGYGERRSEKATYSSVVEDGADVLSAARKAWPDQPLWIFGESLGSGVAAQALARSFVTADRVMLMVPWHRLDTVAAQRYPWVPVKHLIGATFDSCAALQAHAEKTWLVIAEKDRVIPMQHGKSLADCLRLPPERVAVLKNAGHQDWYGALYGTPERWRWLLGTK